MKAGSLFAGIGGFDLGFERAGFEIAWQVEIDDWCRKVLAKHFPKAKRYGDIRDVGSHNLAPVDVVCGGFPCQPFSAAGKQGGAEDDRYLWPEMLRVIRELEPAWVVAENVDALAFGKMEPVFEQVLSSLEGEGYDVQPFIIPACGVDAPHRRNRLWIVAHATVYGMESERIPAKRAVQVAHVDGNSQAVAHSDEPGLEGRDGEVMRERAYEWTLGTNGSHVPHPTGEQVGSAGQSRQGARLHAAWELEPGVGRVADGIPRRVDRLRGLGNAVVPQIPELIARMILEVEQARRKAA